MSRTGIYDPHDGFIPDDDCQQEEPKMTNNESNGSKERMDERLERMHEIECRICTFNIDGVCKLDGGYIPKIGCVGGKAKLMTNADRIRAMTDEELATFLDCYCVSASWECPRHHEIKCHECWLNWLKEEVRTND